MIKAVQSHLRWAIKNASYKIFKNERFRKKVIVNYSNSVFYFKKLNFSNVNKNSSFADILNYKAILKKKHFKCEELYKGNSLYGISSAFRKYAGHHRKINACIEHGVYFGSYVDLKETSKSGFPAVITFSENRKKHIKNETKKPVFLVGPYISYVESFYNETKVNLLKEKLGKTLLVLPVHSIDRLVTNYDIKSFIKEINKIKYAHDFNTVLVCLYWKDILLGRDEIYKNEGFTVVSNGYREDPYFLSRLKTFIEISDHTISNSIGTHIGYSVAMGKPHTVIKQDLEYKGATDLDLKSESVLATSSFLEKEEVFKVFKDFDEQISEKQKEICNKYWGLDKKKSKEVFKFILNTCEAIDFSDLNSEQEIRNKVLKLYQDEKNPELRFVLKDAL
ncbi:hypothetical protein CXF91_13905 [Planococcus sp. Urea-3u-39]|uniref:hypothetical protein n=1 Tax=Planococcus sp. Urea-3u-39 TaxID=2058328 RepID=UPI000C7BBC91|nr:hypothetical protein [Planococcus sp. Urea-3u-39]PKG87103.1 hypothetical protein CXF91_13905 [Planococcus sp. Urea-3u-39]